jgi:hypothetical protein
MSSLEVPYRSYLDTPSQVKVHLLELPTAQESAYFLKFGGGPERRKGCGVDTNRVRYHFEQCLQR